LRKALQNVLAAALDTSRGGDKEGDVFLYEEETFSDIEKSE